MEEKDRSENRVYRDSALTFDQLCVEGKGIPEDVGVTYLPDGSVLICVYLPNVSALSIRAQLEGDLPWDRREDGAAVALLPFRADRTGPQTIDVVVDGNVLLYPYLPIYWTDNRPCNFVDVPDPDDDYLLIRDVPHGVMGHTVFQSDIMNGPERCTVYLPPSYLVDDVKYPVLYLLNGGTDNETSWEYSGRLGYIMDNLLAEGSARPFVIVMVNAMLRTGGRISNLRDPGLDRMITEECIPFIERTFRVKTGKENRALAGLSMGAYLACDIAFSHRDLFSALGTFTACMTTLEKNETYVRPYPDVIVEGKSLQKDFRLFFRSTTPQENHFEWFLADDELCRKYRVDEIPGYTRIVYPENTSKWSSWRKGFRDFARLVF